MESTKKKFWIAIFVLIAISFIFNIIYQITLLNYQSAHTFNYAPALAECFGSLRFGAVFGIILSIAGIVSAIVALFFTIKGKKFDKVTMTSLILASIPLKAGINALTINKSFRQISLRYSDVYYSTSFFTVLVIILAIACLALCLVGAFLKNYEKRHLLTGIGVVTFSGFSAIHSLSMNVPYVYNEPAISFKFRGEPIIATIYILLTIIGVSLFLHINSSKFEEKTPVSAKSREVSVPNNQPSSNRKVELIKKVQEETGLGLVDAKRIVDNREAAVENAMKMYGMTREEAEIATGYNKSDDNPISQLGLPPGLGLNVQQAQQGLNQSAPVATNNFDKQTMQTARTNTPTSVESSGAEIADLKREYLQGKITKEEFNQRLAELRK